MKVNQSIITMDAVTERKDGVIACVRTPLVLEFDAFIVFDYISGTYKPQVFKSFEDADVFRNALIKTEERKGNAEERRYLIRKLA